MYVDETGTPDLDVGKRGVERYYIAAAVFVDEEHAPEAEARVEGIAARLCGGAPIKSSRIGADHECRLRFLQAIQDVDFGYHALAVDKSLVREDSGLRYKASFHKFFSRLLTALKDIRAGRAQECRAARAGCVRARKP